jgi:AcrR family transcriptional regulator
MSRPLPVAVAAATGGDREAVQAHILDAALRVIVRDGLSGASTRAISAESGLAGGTMYNYFAGRVDLVAAAIVRRSELTAEPVVEVAQLAGGGTVFDNLMTFMRHAAAVLDELLPLVASSFAEPELLAQLRLRVASSSSLANPVGGLARYLQAEANLGRIRADVDVNAVSAVIGSMCHDDAFQRHLARIPVPPRTRELDFIVASLERIDRQDA